jgi:ankyrin repeat protein
MDPLSIAASVAGLGTLAYQMIGYLAQVKSGGKERTQLREEVTHLWLTLTALQEILSPDAIKEDRIPDTIRPLLAPDGVIQQIKAQVEDLDDKIKTQSSHSRIAQSLAWPFTQKDAMQIINRISRLQATLHNSLTQANYRVAQDTYRDGQEVKKAINEAKLKELIEWISPLNFVAKQSMIWSQHHKGTCRWFLDRDDFREWREGEGTILFCPGIPGAGKTFLSSIVYNELESLRLREEGGVKGAAVFMLYCKWDDPSSQLLDNLLPSLIKQCVQRYGAVGDHLVELFEKHSKEGTRPAREQVLSTLTLLFRRFTKVFVLLDGLDELKEESERLQLVRTLESNWRDTVPVNLMVTSRPLPNISRHFRDVPYRIDCDGCNKEDLKAQYHCAGCESQDDVSYDLCEPCFMDYKRCGNKGHSLFYQYNASIIPIAAVEEDLTTYVQWRTSTSDFLQQCVDMKDGLMDKILKTVVRDNGGMFLLAKFNMDTLDSKLNIKQVMRALQSLPKELDGTYTDAMTRITELPASTKESVLDFLRWVVFAEQPLHERAIEHALAVEQGDDDIDEDSIIRARILANKCAGLVQFDESDCLRLVHYSAENYFTQHRDRWFPDGSPKLTSACLSYLQFDAFKAGACSGQDEAVEFEERLEKYPFLRYAAMSWGKHLRLESTDDLEAQAISFLTHPGCLASATQALWYLDSQGGISWDAKDSSPIHLATHFGLHHLVEELIMRGYKVDLRDINGATPLALAVIRNNRDIARTLLRAGASVNSVDNNGRAPLHQAIRYKRPDMARLLLDQPGIDINLGHPKWSYMTPLITAAVWGAVNVINMLLARPEIQVNKTCTSPSVGTTALIYAAHQGQTEAVKALLTHPDIDIDAKDNSCSTALTYASQGGYYATAEALLDKGADTEVLQAGSEGTAIMRAIDGNQISNVKLLIKRGANLHHKDTFGRGVLHSAAVNKRAEILRILLAKDPTLDVNMRDAHGKTTLHDIARWGHTETIEVLLAHGGDPTIKDNHGRTPMRVAREMNLPHVLDMFRAARERQKAEKQATGRTNSGLQRTDTGSLVPGTKRTDTNVSLTGALPIWSLARSDKLEELKEILPDASVDEINLTEPDMGQAALHYAVNESSIEVVQLLIKHGADINMPNRYGRTPLHVAAMYNRWDSAEALLDAGADMTLRDIWGHQALLMAEHIDRSVALLLITRGAPLDASSMNLDSYLNLAARGGYVEAAKRLVAAGADVWGKNTDGKSKYAIAKEHGHEELAKIILQLAPRPSLSEQEETGSTIGSGTSVGTDATDVTESTNATSESVSQEKAPESQEKESNEQESHDPEEEKSPERTEPVAPASTAVQAVQVTELNKASTLLSRHLYTLVWILVLITATTVARIY